MCLLAVSVGPAYELCSHTDIAAESGHVQILSDSREAEHDLCAVAARERRPEADYVAGRVPRGFRTLAL